MGQLRGTTVVVAGAGHGFGPAVAEALLDAGARVVGVGTNLGTLAAALGVGFVPESEPLGREGREALLRRYGARLVVLVSEDACGWGDAAVVLRVPEDELFLAGGRLGGVSPRIAAVLRPLLVQVQVGRRLVELAERALSAAEAVIPGEPGAGAAR